jgi:hypothetical protein
MRNWLLFILLLIPTFAFGQRVFTCTFDAAYANGTWNKTHPDGWNIDVGTSNCYSAVAGPYKHSGLTAAHFTYVVAGSIADRAGYNGYNIPTGTKMYALVWVYFPSGGSPPTPAPPSANQYILAFSDGISKDLRVIWTTDDKIGIAQANTTPVVTSTNVTPKNARRPMWIYTNHTTSNDTMTVIFNGETISTTAFVWTSNPMTQVYIGLSSFSPCVGDCKTEFYMDDLMINGGAGSYHNSFPDTNSMLIYDRLISDSSIAGWTGGGGGTTNIFGGVDNAPPQGVINTLETDATNITNIASGGTDRYFGKTASFTTAGVPSDKTIRLVAGVVRTGEDTTAGTTNGRIQLYNNPTDTGTNTFIFGNDLEAHRIDFYSFGAPEPVRRWYTSFSRPVNFPTINRDSGTTIMVEKTTAAATKVCVDDVARIIEYGAAQEGSIQMQSDIQFWGYMRKRIPFIQSEIFYDKHD